MAARSLDEYEGRLNAAQIAIVCIEEAAKVSILRRIATSKGDAERREVWHEYRSHRSKNRHSIGPSPLGPAVRHLDIRTEAATHEPTA
jgi:AbiV family abortive infection protein